MHVHPPGCATNIMVTSKKKTNFTADHHSMSSIRIRVLHLGTDSDACIPLEAGGGQYYTHSKLLPSQRLPKYI